MTIKQEITSLKRNLNLEVHPKELTAEWGGDSESKIGIIVEAIAEDGTKRIISRIFNLEVETPRGFLLLDMESRVENQIERLKKKVVKINRYIQLTKYNTYLTQEQEDHIDWLIGEYSIQLDLNEDIFNDYCDTVVSLVKQGHGLLHMIKKLAELYRLSF